MTLYFAYGSNLNATQMATRCPDAHLLGVGQLPGYRLAFAGQSVTWGGGVATVIQDSQHSVNGLIWRITPQDLATLDRCEGHPWAYQRQRLSVNLKGRRRQVQVYVKPEPELTRPSLAYFRVIHKAYELHGFDYKPLIQAVGGSQ